MDNDFSPPQNFINRELSWLEFNKRVLEWAQDSEVPLFERLKFAAIVSSNLDEFFMVRVASVADQILVGFDQPDPSGLSPQQVIENIFWQVHRMVADQYVCYNRSLLTALRKEKIQILKWAEMNHEQRKALDDYYLRTVYPVLTPLVVDKSRPFPLVLNKSLNIALLLETDDNEFFATVQVPSVLPRLVEVRTTVKGSVFVLLEEIIKIHLEELFCGHMILTSGCYRITRNSDLDWDEDEAEDLLEAIEESLRQRKWGAAIRLEAEKGLDKRLLTILREELEISEEKVYEIKGPIDLTFLMNINQLEGYNHLSYAPLKPQSISAFQREDNYFNMITQHDILLHHPYQAFDPVVNIVRTAACDPDVLAIKETLYRVSGNSAIIEALAQAAENGKQVTVLVELKARFDEEKNIHWAKRLEKAGCHVIFGMVNLKTHCKLLLIVRKEEDGIKRYVHFSTGNYNDVTAKIYTDLSLFTANLHFGADASAVFNMLSGLSQPSDLHKLTIAPFGLRQRILELIEQEADNARQGKRGKIIVKINSLVDVEIIKALYAASGAGVTIDLIVRGICCLRPGLPGVSEHISVRSIVGRFLEHSRIFFFHNGGDNLLFLSSADWMTRNLDHRVEVLFPIEDQEIKNEIMSILNISLQDTLKARILQADGTYRKIDKRSKKLVDSQDMFYKLAMERAEEGKREK